LEFCDGFPEHFRPHARDVARTTTHYLSGPMRTRRKNMERMTEVWCRRATIRRWNMFYPTPTGMNARCWTGWRFEPMLCSAAWRIRHCRWTIAASPRDRRHSVDVTRQRNGRLGKIDNCRVGVCAALSRGADVPLIDTRLYLSQSRVDDPARYRAAGVPATAHRMQTKPQLALTLVRRQRRLGARFAWVGMDGSYGKDPALWRALYRDGETVLAEVHKNQLMFLEDRDPRVPEAPQRGRPCIRLIAQLPSLCMDEGASAQPQAAWQLVGSEGELTVEGMHRRISLRDGQEARERARHLIVRPEITAREEIEYGPRNAPSTTTARRLTRMPGQRCWGRARLSRRQEPGRAGPLSSTPMARSASPYGPGDDGHAVHARRAAGGTRHASLLGCADVETLLAHVLPRCDCDIDEVIRQLEVRHRKRQASIGSADSRQQCDPSRGLPEM
jgi:hypothetical protein